MEVRCGTPRAETPTCGLCRKPLHWWCTDWAQVNPQSDPVGFLSLWWACFTDLRTLGHFPRRDWAYKCRCLMDRARGSPGPTSEILIQGLHRWPRPPRGLEGLQHDQSLHDCIPSPWQTHPWTGTPLRDAPVPIALWRLATWRWIHETGRFRSEQLRQWTACLWPWLPWDALLGWVRTPGFASLETQGPTLEDDRAQRADRPWRPCFRDTYCYVHLQNEMPIESWARHPPPAPSDAGRSLPFAQPLGASWPKHGATFFPALPSRLPIAAWFTLPKTNVPAVPL
jgi:hypothetical protein